MKKIVLVSFIISCIIFSTIPSTVFATNTLPTISAPSGILIDGDTGDVLYEKDAHRPMYPASTTKIMTAILTIENANLDEQVVIDKDTPFTDGSRIYVIEGEVLTVEQLLYALLVDSANDAAVALAKHVSGSVEEFAKLMNKRAKELGAKNTHFMNPNGLPNDEHVTTAYDLAMIGKYAMTLPKLPEIVSTVRYQIPPTNKQVETRYLKNSNRFLWGVGGRNKIFYQGKWIDIKYDIIEGVKTGYTIQAQQCLITSAKKNDHRLISVVLNAQGTNIYADSRTLIDYGFDNFDFLKLTDSGLKIKSVVVKGGTEKHVDLLTKDQLFKAIDKNKELPPIEKVVEMDEEMKAPIEEGQSLGKILFKAGDEVLGETALIAAKSVPKKEGLTSIFYNSSKNIFSFFHLFGLLIFIFLIWRCIVTYFRLRKRKNKLSTKYKK